MPVEDVANSLFWGINFAWGVKAFLILFLVFYSVFALMLFRQIQLMIRTLPTQLSPFLKFLAIVHIGISLAILLMVIGTF